MEQKVSFLKRKMPVRVCFLFCVIAFALLMMYNLLNGCSTDLYYVAATGREIVKNGFPHTSVWNIDRTGGFVVQQWLYCVIVYYLDALPVWSYSIFAMIQVVILAYLSFIFLKMRGLSKYKIGISVCFALFVDYIYIFIHRPETVTLILLMGECVALEKFRHTSKCRYLFALPVIMILEMNFHGAMWPMHYAILAAYMVPAFYFKKAENIAIYASWKKLLPFVICMTGSMFLNPYGANGVAYAIRSLTVDTFRKLDIYEMNMPQLFSPSLGVLILSIFFLFFIIKYGHIDSIAANMIVGFTVLSLFTYRHVMFSYFTILFVASLFLQVDTLISKIDFQKDLYNYYYIPFALLTLLLTSMNVSAFSNASGTGLIECMKRYEPGVYAITQYLEDNDVDKHTRIFTSSSGSCLEYCGYDNIYFDTRYELYSPVFTGGVDYASDFYKYCSSGVAYVSMFAKDDPDKSYIADDGTMQQWLDQYDFQYFIVGPDTAYLSGYLAGNPNYERVDVSNYYNGKVKSELATDMLYKKIS